MKQVPNFFTLLNLVFGCWAIVLTLQHDSVVLYLTEEDTKLLNIPEKLAMASFMIGLAAVVDFLDGFVARLFKATSPMGEQLDSLADVVSFGVAPGMILYQFLRLSYARESAGLDTPVIWLLPALILPCAAAWRLARFNLDKNQVYSFTGVPTPAVGLTVASLPLIYWFNDKESVRNLLLNKWLLYAVTLVLSYLMVSGLQIISLKFRDYSLRNNMPKVILLLGSVVLVILLRWLAPPFIFLLYIAVSLFFKNKPA